jgi:hypothetical protein
MSTDTLVYQTRGSAGRRTAKWHQVNADGRSACTGLPVEPAKSHRAEDVAPKNLCRAKACSPQSPERTPEEER